MKPPTPSEDLDDDVVEGPEKWSANIVGDFDDHKSAVGRVEWNITGCVVFIEWTLGWKAGTLTQSLVAQDDPLVGWE